MATFSGSRSMNGVTARNPSTTTSAGVVSTTTSLSRGGVTTTANPMPATASPFETSFGPPPPNVAAQDEASFNRSDNADNTNGVEEGEEQGLAVWAIVLAVVLPTLVIVSLIVAAVFSAEFSHEIRELWHLATQLSDEASEIGQRCVDLIVCSWFFMGFPILNIGLAAGLGVNVNEFKKAAGFSHRTVPPSAMPLQPARAQLSVSGIPPTATGAHVTGRM